MPPTRRSTTKADAPAGLDSKRAVNAEPPSEPGQADLDALRAEVGDDYIIIPIGDNALRVKPFLDWPASASEFLALGRFSLWAAKALHPEDAQKWLQIDPTHRQVADFFTDWEEVTGIPLGSMFSAVMR